MKCKISSFLKERQDRFKPKEASLLGLKRIEKITQNGDIFVSDKPSSTNMILVKPGDLVLSGIGIAKGGGNSLNIYEGEEDVLTTIHYSSYMLDRSKITEDFLKIFLISPYFRKLLQESSPNGIKAEIKPKHFLPIEVDLPNLEKQKEVVEKIEAIKEDIEQLERESKKDQIRLEKLRKAILSEAVQGKLVPQNPKDESAEILLKKIKTEKEKLIKEKRIKKEKPLPEIAEEEIPYRLPKGWVWCRLGQIIKNLRYGTSKKCDYDSRGAPILRIPNIRKGIITLEDLKFTSLEKKEENNLRLKENDLLLIRSNGSKTLVGKSAVIQDAGVGCCYAGYLIRLRLFEEYIYSRYLFLVLESNLVRKQIEEPIRTTSGVKNINSNEVSRLIIPIPLLKEQKRIVEKVDKLMELCDELEKKINKNGIHSEMLMDAVLREVFEN